ncbi:MAG: hypothetical protein J4478_02940 [Candidatus Diapherotrites archaeon]|uniref:Uncharacterized protein n=1 Tax=Candidatus Iainarchaeum sp. TaxID=3101447 RepID=A0A7J4K3L4_9ARCH|nr:MAG: hypothetical protein QT12_C0014G0003 [archaeon GW2011_AR21]MBS3058333.1 hypothetical protein [Candidatus Diapherotrites archaeon]HIH22076.1 hypothetical protein [Candidatus Diapherotrites archaeon]HIH33466.1 hypothetical protein [Candidatus Diapherotrites archaeon]
MSRLKRLKKANWEASFRIRKKAIEKLFGLKHPSKVFVYFSQVLIVFLIALGILVWIDPAVNVIPAPLSYFFLLVLLVILAYVQFAFKRK